MKRFIAAMLVLITAGVFAAGVKEQGEMTITIVGHQVGPTYTVYDAALDKVKEKFPFVRYEYYGVDVLSGVDVTTLALVSSGSPPDVYVDFVGRAGKYAYPGYALELNIDETPWIKSQLDLFRVDGKLYGLPSTVPAQAMALNLDVLAKAGVTPPERAWTIEEFITACEKVKAANIPGVYATGLFAVNPSGDYLWQHWFMAFGMSSMFNSDYTRSAANAKQVLDTWRFFALMKERGYIHPNSSMWTDDDYWDAFAKGNMAMFPVRPDWLGTVPYNWIMVSLPSPTGDIVGSIGAGSVAVGAKTDDPMRAAVVHEIIERFNDVEFQQATTRSGIPTRYDVPVVEFAKGFDVVYDLIQAKGMLDVGYSKRWYGEVRAVGPEVLQSLLKGDITPEQAHVTYYERVQRILDK